MCSRWFLWQHSFCPTRTGFSSLWNIRFTCVNTCVCPGTGSRTIRFASSDPHRGYPSETTEPSIADSLAYKGTLYLHSQCHHKIKCVFYACPWTCWRVALPIQMETIYQKSVQKSVCPTCVESQCEPCQVVELSLSTVHMSRKIIECSSCIRCDSETARHNHYRHRHHHHQRHRYGLLQLSSRVSQ